MSSSLYGETFGAMLIASGKQKSKDGPFSVFLFSHVGFWKLTACKVLETYARFKESVIMCRGCRVSVMISLYTFQISF